MSETCPLTYKLRITHYYIFFSAFNLFWIVFSMVGIENTLNINNIQGVTSFVAIAPGQLIPLLIGAASLLRVTYIIFRNKYGWVGIEEETTPGAEGEFDKKYTEESDPTTSNKPSRPRCHILHHIIHAWLPWLSLFTFFRQPNDLQYKKIGPLRSEEPEGPDAAMLGSGMQLQSDKKNMIVIQEKTASSGDDESWRDLHV
jgi:hypothetical protein